MRMLVNNSEVSQNNFANIEALRVVFIFVVCIKTSSNFCSFVHMFFSDMLD